MEVAEIGESPQRRKAAAESQKEDREEMSNGNLGSKVFRIVSLVSSKETMESTIKALLVISVLESWDYWGMNEELREPPKKGAD